MPLLSCCFLISMCSWLLTSWLVLLWLVILKPAIAVCVMDVSVSLPLSFTFSSVRSFIVLPSHCKNIVKTQGPGQVKKGCLQNYQLLLTSAILLCFFAMLWWSHVCRYWGPGTGRANNCVPAPWSVNSTTILSVNKPATKIRSVNNNNTLTRRRV